jgi:hypothetical protein
MKILAQLGAMRVAPSLKHVTRTVHRGHRTTAFLQGSAIGAMIKS